MELKANKRYLVDLLQTDALSKTHGLMCVRCLEVTDTSFKIEYENGDTRWIKKGLYINVVEELKPEQDSAKCEEAERKVLQEWLDEDGLLTNEASLTITTKLNSFLVHKKSLTNIQRLEYNNLVDIYNMYTEGYKLNHVLLF